MYSTKRQDIEKRQAQEGSYSLYNHLYHFLLDNYEVENVTEESKQGILNLLLKEGISYAIKGGKSTSENEIYTNAKKALDSFCKNDGEHGDTAHNLGKVQHNSLPNIKRTISGLKW